jgi:hypothetical protein
MCARFKPVEHRPEGALRDAILGSIQTLLFGINHDNELAPPGHQFGAPDRQIIRQRARWWAHGFSKVGDHCRVDRVGLGQSANGAGELAHLARIDNGDRKAGCGERGGDHAFIAAARLEDYQRGRPRLQSRDQSAQTFRVCGAAERGAIRSHMQVDPRLRHVDANKAIRFALDIHHPTSLMRARAQTTVRVYGISAGAARSLSASTATKHSG